MFIKNHNVWTTNARSRSESSQVCNENLSEILPCSSWALGQATWPKGPEKYLALKWGGRCFKITIFGCVSTSFLLALHPWMWQNYIIKLTNRNLSKFYVSLLLSKLFFTVTVLHWRYWYIHLGCIVDVTPKRFKTHNDCLKYLQAVIRTTFSSVLL